MKKIIIISILLFVIGDISHAQSIYHLKYDLKSEKDKTVYDAFLLLNGNGTAMVRIRYGSPGSSNEVIIAMDATEEDLSDPSVKRNIMGYRLSSPAIKKQGTEIPKYTIPYFWFKQNESSGIYEPWGVTVTAAQTDADMRPFTVAESIAGKDLNKDLVLQYFTTQDEFYKNKFVNGEKALTPLEKNTKMILVTVANIKDTSIGPACKLDMERAIASFSRLAMLMGISIDTSRKISGDNYNKTNIEKAINSLAPAKNDIVIFYYSGHGFRKPGSTVYYPDLDLRAKIEKRYADNVKSLKVNYLNAEDILTRINKKGARLNMVITDCCNLHYDSVNCKGMIPPKTKEMPLDIYRENARALFFDPTPRSLLFTAASPGEKALSNNDMGSFFSYYFIKAVENHLSYFKKKVSWDQVFAETKYQTTAKSLRSTLKNNSTCEQTPFTNLLGQ